MRSDDLTVAVDIGGTFTDVTLADRATGRLWRAKTPSTPADPSEAFLTGVMLALTDAGARPAAVGRVLHGTTVATNLILEGKTARTALVTTAGFRHVLEIGRQDIPRTRQSVHLGEAATSGAADARAGGDRTRGRGRRRADRIG